MSWNADDGTTGTRRSRPGRSHSAAVTDWLGRTSSAGLPSSRHTGHGGGSYPTQSSQQLQQEQARLVLTLTGWRRRALFGLLLTLTVIVIINLSLTLWLLRSMQFSLVRKYHITYSFVSISLSLSICYSTKIQLSQPSKSRS